MSTTNCRFWNKRIESITFLRVFQRLKWGSQLSNTPQCFYRTRWLHHGASENRHPAEWQLLEYPLHSSSALQVALQPARRKLQQGPGVWNEVWQRRHIYTYWSGNTRLNRSSCNRTLIVVSGKWLHPLTKCLWHAVTFYREHKTVVSRWRTAVGLMTFHYISSKVNRLDTSFPDGLKQYRTFLLKDHLYFFSNFFQIVEAEKPRKEAVWQSQQWGKTQDSRRYQQVTFDRLLQLCWLNAPVNIYLFTIYLGFLNWTAYRKAGS